MHWCTPNIHVYIFTVSLHIFAPRFMFVSTRSEIAAAVAAAAAAATPFAFQPQAHPVQSTPALALAPAPAPAPALVSAPTPTLNSDPAVAMDGVGVPRVEAAQAQVHVPLPIVTSQLQSAMLPFLWSLRGSWPLYTRTANLILCAVKALLKESLRTDADAFTRKYWEAVEEVCAAARPNGVILATPVAVWGEEWARHGKMIPIYTRNTRQGGDTPAEGSSTTTTTTHPRTEEQEVLFVQHTSISEVERHPVVPATSAGSGAPPNPLCGPAQTPLKSICVLEFLDLVVQVIANAVGRLKGEAREDAPHPCAGGSESRSESKSESGSGSGCGGSSADTGRETEDRGIMVLHPALTLSLCMELFFVACNSAMSDPRLGLLDFQDVLDVAWQACAALDSVDGVVTPSLGNATQPVFLEHHRYTYKVALLAGLAKVMDVLPCVGIQLSFLSLMQKGWVAATHTNPDIGVVPLLARTLAKVLRCATASEGVSGVTDTGTCTTLGRARTELRGKAVRTAQLLLSVECWVGDLRHIRCTQAGNRTLMQQLGAKTVLDAWTDGVRACASRVTPVNHLRALASIMTYLQSDVAAFKFTISPQVLAPAWIATLCFLVETLVKAVSRVSHAGMAAAVDCLPRVLIPLVAVGGPECRSRVWECLWVLRGCIRQVKTSTSVPRVAIERAEQCEALMRSLDRVYVVPEGLGKRRRVDTDLDRELNPETEPELDFDHWNGYAGLGSVYFEDGLFVGSA